MIRVAALTSGPNFPSRRFRIQQFINPLSSLGVQVAEYCLSMDKYRTASHKRLRSLVGAQKLLGRIPGVIGSQFADITWLEREFLPGRFTLEGLTGARRLFDVDDAIWLGGNSNFAEDI